MQFWLSAYEKICVTLSHARMWKQWDSFSKALTSNSYLGNYWGMLSQKVNVFNELYPQLFCNRDFNASIHKLTLKNKPNVRTIHRSDSETPLYLYTLWCAYIQALFLVTAAGLSSTLVQSSRKRQQGSWPALFTTVSAPKLTSTLRSADIETNKCFYLRAPIMSMTLAE